jgi:hypothetical protein
MKPRKPLHSVFLRAAELQLANKEGADNRSTSCYSCDNIGHALIEAKLDNRFCGTVEHEFFAAWFRPGHLCCGWWPSLADDSHDHESRILALLLCAEMLKR